MAPLGMTRAALLFAQIITYPMGLLRWFLIDHSSFWHGFKDLVWVLCPGLNFGYVWDWWLNLFRVLLLGLKLFVSVLSPIVGFLAENWFGTLMLSAPIAAAWAYTVWKERRQGNQFVRNIGKKAGKD